MMFNLPHSTRLSVAGPDDTERLETKSSNKRDLYGCAEDLQAERLSDGVDVRTIQLMLGHADIKQTQRYLNITDEELRKAMTGVWERRRQLRAEGSRSGTSG
jgi:integrase